MPSLQVQARALGDPTRHRIFEYIVDAEAARRGRRADRAPGAEPQRDPTASGEARRCGAGGRVQRSPLGTGTAATAVPREPRDRESLGSHRALRATVGTARRGRPHRRPTPSRWAVGRRLSGPDPAHGDDPVAALVGQMARQGFDPAVTQTGDLIDITLQECPFTSAAMTDPDTVCGLHLGLARGVAESVGGITVDELLPADPRRAQCQLRCHLDGGESPRSDRTRLTAARTTIATARPTAVSATRRTGDVVALEVDGADHQQRGRRAAASRASGSCAPGARTARTTSGRRHR